MSFLGITFDHSIEDIKTSIRIYNRRSRRREQFAESKAKKVAAQTEEWGTLDAWFGDPDASQADDPFSRNKKAHTAEKIARKSPLNPREAVVCLAFYYYSRKDIRKYKPGVEPQDLFNMVQCVVQHPKSWSSQSFVNAIILTLFTPEHLLKWFLRTCAVSQHQLIQLQQADADSDKIQPGKYCMGQSKHSARGSSN
ncbi:hypothetical protein HKX48_006949 [Thoreauomyces humboldtii]|nr:hypothetical protein HKX48_006949 [Thoreauomyces humboldtii]